MFGQFPFPWCLCMLPAEYCLDVACVAGFELCEPPWFAASATPPPVTATTTVPTTTATLLDRASSPPFARILQILARTPKNGLSGFYACGMRASRAAPSASRTGASLIRSSTSWKKPRTISRSGLGTRQPPRHQVEELLPVDATERGAVRAAHVVRHDLEARDRIGVCRLGEQQIAVLLVRVGLLRTFLDANHAAPDDALRTLSRSAPLNAKSLSVFGAMCSWNVS